MRTRQLLLIALFLACAGCSAAVPGPQPAGDSSPQAVMRSLGTVDPGSGLPLFEYDRSVPFDIQGEVQHEVDGLTRLDFTYESPRGGRVPARLIMPPGEGPFPAIVYMHGSSGDIELMTPEAERFARLGAAGILIDSPHIRPGGYTPDGSMGSTWPYYTEQDRLDQIQLMVDLQRAVDILVARPDVDADRLAYLGISYGGAMGGLLAGIETRLKAYVLIVGDGGLVEHTSKPRADGRPDHFSESWVDLMWPIEPLHYVGRAAPAALLFQNGLADRSVPPSDAVRYQTAGSEPKTIMWYEGGHEISGWTSAWADRARWLQNYLGRPLTWFAPDYHAGIVWADRAWSVWAVLSLVSAAYFCWAFARAGVVGLAERTLWCLAGMLLGPFSLLMYRFSAGVVPHRQTSGVVPSGWRGAAASGTYIASAMGAALLIGTLLDNLVAARSPALQLAIAYLLPVLIFWGLLGLIHERITVNPGARLLLANLLWALSMPIGSWLSQRLDLTTDLDPRIWLVFAIAGMAGWLAALPAAHMLTAWHWIRWPQSISGGQTHAIRAPGLWTALIVGLSFLLVLVAIGAVIVLSSGMSLAEVIAALG